MNEDAAGWLAVGFVVAVGIHTIPTPHWLWVLLAYALWVC